MLKCQLIPLDTSETLKLRWDKYWVVRPWRGVVKTSLDGFRRAIHLTAAMGMESVRDAWITSLAKLTSLHSPSNMRTKNIEAMRALVAGPHPRPLFGST